MYLTELEIYQVSFTVKRAFLSVYKKMKADKQTINHLLSRIKLDFF